MIRSNLVHACSIEFQLIHDKCSIPLGQTHSLNFPLDKLISVSSFALMSVRVPVERPNGYGQVSKVRWVKEKERERKGGRREYRVGERRERLEV